MQVPRIGQTVVHERHVCWMSQVRVGDEQFVMLWGGCKQRYKADDGWSEIVGTIKVSESVTAELAGHLITILGNRLTSYICGVTDPEALERFANDLEHPDPLIEARLWSLHKVVALFREAGYQPEAVQTWFMSMNPELWDKSPAELMAEDHSSLGAVLQAAKTYVYEGMY